MINKSTILMGSFCLAFSVGNLAKADVQDEKPWDWERYSYITDNKQGGTICKSLVDDFKNPKLTCTIDHKSWDDHLKHELKVFKISDRNLATPDRCDGVAFQFLRPLKENGGFPVDNGADPVIAEFKSKVDNVDCRWEETEKPGWITYDAKKKSLVFHLTRTTTDNSQWAKKEIRKLKSVFPLLDKWYAQRE